jgi:DNA-binding IclR family transcriptional regulator
MSMSPETGTRADRLVTLISRWLARHVSDEELRQALEEIGPGDLSADQAKAVEELRAELAAGRGGAELEMVARETLEALALG